MIPLIALQNNTDIYYGVAIPDMVNVADYIAGSYPSGVGLFCFVFPAFPQR